MCERWTYHMNKMKVPIFVWLFLALFARFGTTESSGKLIFNLDWDELNTSEQSSSLLLNFKKFQQFILEYYAGVAGGVCNNENDVIRTKDECTKALLKKTGVLM